MIEEVRKTNPLIHCLTNGVVQNITANGLLSFGASPIMANNPEEAADIAKIADAILINIGTLQNIELEAMKIAGKVANEQNIPVVFDPVGVGASRFRQRVCQHLLEEIQFTAIKGNAGEMAHLVGETIATKGVDSSHADVALLEKVAEKVAQQYNTLAVITGKTDIISDGQQTFRNDTGNDLLKTFTGSGCLLGALIAATLTSSRDPLQAIDELVHFYGSTADDVLKNKAVEGIGTFQMHFIDALSK